MTIQMRIAILPLAAIAAILAAAPPAAAQASGKTGQASTIASKQAALTPVDNIASRIRRLHDQLRITSDQDALWTPVASAMRDHAKAITDAMQARQDKAATMNALDDIQSYGDLAQVHADGLKKLAAAFAPLYAAMPTAQQQNANAVFGYKIAASKKD